MKIIIVGLNLSSYITTKNELCCICYDPLRPSNIRPYSAVLCITTDMTNIYYTCHKCAIVSWLYTYTAPLESISKIIDTLTHKKLVGLLKEKNTNSICTFFSCINKFSKVLYVEVLFGGIPTCYYCRKRIEKKKKGKLCSECNRTVYCSKTCLNKDKYKHRKLTCNQLMFIDDKVFK